MRRPSPPAREKKMARSGALKTLSYAMNGAEGASIANRCGTGRREWWGRDGVVRTPSQGSRPPPAAVVLRRLRCARTRGPHRPQIRRRSRAAVLLPGADGQGTRGCVCILGVPYALTLGPR